MCRKQTFLIVPQECFLGYYYLLLLFPHKSAVTRNFGCKEENHHGNQLCNLIFEIFSSCKF